MIAVSIISELIIHKSLIISVNDDNQIRSNKNMTDINRTEVRALKLID